MNKRRHEIRNICTNKKNFRVLENVLTSFGPIINIILKETNHKSNTNRVMFASRCTFKNIYRYFLFNF